MSGVRQPGSGHDPHRSGLKDRQGGSVLVATMLVLGMAVFLVASFGSSTRTQMEMSRELIAELRADMAVQSGVEYSRRQLALDTAWNGTDAPMQLSGLGSFEVVREAPVPGQAAIVLSVTGLSPLGRKRLEASFEVIPGDPLRTKGLVAMNPQIDIAKSGFEGSVFLNDNPDLVQTYSEAEQRQSSGTPWWMAQQQQAQGTSPPPGTIPLGVQMQYTNSQIFSFGVMNWETDPTIVEVTLDKLVVRPGFDLDAYLIPGPGKVIYNGVTSLAGVILDETAVFILQPGDSLSLTDVALRGGAVVYVDNTYDVATPYRNQVVIGGSGNVIGGGLMGVHPNIGLLAPACQLSGLDQSADAVISGTSLCHSINGLYHFTFSGQLIVYNQIQAMRFTQVIFQPSVGLSPPPGIRFFGDYGDSLDLVLLREVYDDVFSPSGSPAGPALGGGGAPGGTPPK